MKHKKPMVSVVMPVYNGVLYIEEAVQSILDQTFTDFELIIIDDGSTDGTTDLLKTLKDTRIKLIFFEKNKGVSSATNQGFKEAKGTYIARMDGDDISVKERFEKQVGVLESNPDIIVCGGLVQYLGGNNNVIGFKETHDEIITELLISCSICMGASMFRRETLQGYYYDETRRSGEDYEFWTRVAWKGKMYNIQEVLLLYRVHVQQASIMHKPQQIIDDVEIRLQLFKKLDYDMQYYSDNFLTTMLLLNKHIRVDDLIKFIRWLKTLPTLNYRAKVFPNKSFKKALKQLERSTLFSIYFKETAIGIDKNWRMAALWRLPLDAIFFVLNVKKRELIKRFLKR